MTNSTNKQPHQYRGSLIICLDCNLPRNNPIHITLDAAQTIEARNAAQVAVDTIPVHRHVCTRCSGVWVHEKSEDNMNCSLSEHTLCTTCESRTDAFSQAYPLLSVITDSNAIAEQENHCKGHVCPVCGSTWQHDYACSNKPINTACEKCATQSTSETFRQTNIQQLAQTSSQVLHPREVIEMLVQYDAVIWNMSHDPVTKALLPDGLEKIHVERRNLQQLQEKLQHKAIRIRKLEVDFQNELMTTLSEDEKAQYKRDAKKKEKAADSPDKPKKERTSNVPDAKELYNKLIKNLADEIRTRRPNMKADELLAAAERRYKLMNEEDAI